jgi:hypothetical protein
VDKRHYSFHHRFVLVSLLAIVIFSFGLSYVPQQVVAVINNSSGLAKMPISSSSSQLESKTTGNENPSDLNQTYLPIITIIVLVASAAAALATYYYAKKAFHFNALIKAFELLNDNAHRNARIRLYRVAGVENPIMRRAYLKELGVKDEALETIIPESQNIVLADLDQMGTFVKKKLVPEKEFLDVYWNTVISCYDTLKSEKKIELYLDFKDLYDSAVKHRKTSIPLEKEIFGPNASLITFH